MAVEELTVRLNDEVTANARKAGASAKALAEKFKDLKGVERSAAIAAAKGILKAQDDLAAKTKKTAEKLAESLTKTEERRAKRMEDKHLDALRMNKAFDDKKKAQATKSATKLAEELGKSEEKRLSKMDHAHGQALEMNKKFNERRVNETRKHWEKIDKAHGQALEMNKKFQKKLTPGNTIKRTETGGIGGMLNSFVGNVGANAAASAAGMAKDLAVASVTMAVNGLVFQDNAIRGLTFLTKSGAEAKRVYGQALQLADDLGVSSQDTVTQMQTFMAQGMSSSAAQDLIVSMAALKQVNPAAKTEGITRAMMQISATGKLQGDELMQLAEAGLSVDDVYATLGKRLGKTRDEILKMQAAGKISSKDAIAAINESISAKVGGDPRKVAESGKGSLGGRLAQLQNLPMNMMAKLEANPAAMKAVSDAIGKFVDSVSKPETVAAISKLAAAFLQFSAGAIDKLADGITKVTSLMDRMGMLSPDPKAAVAGAAGGEKQTAGAVAMQAAGGAAVDTGASLLAGILLPGIGPIIATAVMGSKDPSKSSGTEVGTAISDGIIAGMTGNLGGVFAAGARLAAEAVAGSKSAAQVKSPSRVFRDEVGAQMAAGMAVGLSGGAALVSQAAADVVAGSVPANTNGRAMGGGGTGGATINAGGITINIGGGGGGGGSGGGGGAPSGQAIGQDAAKAFWTEVRKLAEAG